MKKIFLSGVLLLTLFVNNVSHAAELVLYSQDNFEVKSDAYVVDAQKFISIVNGSNLVITYTNNKDYAEEKNEPKIDFSISREGTKEVVLSLKSPTEKVSPNNVTVFENHLKKYKTYFEQVGLEGNRIKIQVPLKFAGGKYTVALAVNQDGKKMNLNFPITISESAYMFTKSDVVIEDANVLANIGYVSLSGVDSVNKVAITLTQGTTELFRKEIEKKFFSEGTIIVDETVSQLKDLKGAADLKIEIKDADGKVILTQTQSVGLQKATDAYIYYAIVALLILLLIALFFIMRTKRLGVVATTAMFVVMITVAGFVSFGVHAAQTCGGVDKPDDRCVEDKIVTSVCKITDSCSDVDANLKKFFSTGRVVSVSTEAENIGPVKASIDVCTNINTSFVSGDTFYVISDSQGSSWQRKRMHIFKFTKGSAETVTFDPGGDKRNVNYAIYNGTCNVNVYSKYSGRNSSFRTAKTKIVEVGVISGNMCRSKSVNEDVFESNSNLFSRPECSRGDLRNTYIAGSVYMEPVYNEQSAWAAKTVDVCKKLGITSSDVAQLKSQNKSFYSLFEFSGNSGFAGSWVNLRFPVYAFKFGTVYEGTNAMIDQKNAQYGNGEGIKYVYRYGTSKENYPNVIYDGGCNVTFDVDYRGEDTETHSVQLKMIELGMSADATCRDPILVDTTTAAHQGAYKWDTSGVASGMIETITKTEKYQRIAPFFPKLGDCNPTPQVCSFKGDWIDSATDATCEPLPTCGATNNTCGAGQELVSRTNTTTEYKWACKALSGSVKECSALKPTGPTAGVCSTANNGICLQGTSVDLTDTATEYKWRCDGLNGGANTSCSLPINPAQAGVCSTSSANTCTTPGAATNITTNATHNLWTCPGVNGGASTACQLPLGTGNPPDITITKNPAVTLNKGGQCTISWEIKDMPTGAKCFLSGWGIGGVPSNVTKEITTADSPEVIQNLIQNQKYVITCSGGTLTPALSKSVICRVNPDIKEN